VDLAEELQEEPGWETPSAEQIAAMLAAARYFTFYLQEKGKLKSVFLDLQKLTPKSGAGDPAKESIRVLETHLGSDVDRIDRDFLAWFERVE
jgi:hypothetical protein